MLVAGALGPETSEVRGFFQLKGGFNGGTLATMLNVYESGADKAVGDPFLPSPSITRAPRELERDPTRSFYDTDLKASVAPFMMSRINTRVVRRSCAILGVDFAYQEYTKLGDAASAFVLAAAGALMESSMHFAPMRNFVRTVAPAPGEGPSEQTMDGGWFRLELFGKTPSGRVAQGIVSDKGDPANRVTVKCLCESALALALDPLPDRAGVLTPSSGIGEALLTRLRARGMTLTAA
jgi:short subunit dehydrogenase-like uncharacterized protein